LFSFALVKKCFHVWVVDQVDVSAGEQVLESMPPSCWCPSLLFMYDNLGLTVTYLQFIFWHFGYLCGLIAQ
jgi:hypothetical protein